MLQIIFSNGVLSIVADCKVMKAKTSIIDKYVLIN